ncbi:hypothetical protein [Halobellus limi]|uniref:Uncharacterized protein n=1 Tax=Halobellus limi TaxID=699433 RepID=A0A1H5ZJ53_9EURY|nr:hypothetical protein [Halobellus limi]QCC48085.1 hypothetical protein DV707_10675 [Halobellus limi]SEG36034.1 hypothetical protein SAMN04488133_2010 [Halobellus limi]
MVDYSETAAQIIVEYEGERLVVTDLDLQSEYDMERNYGSGYVVPESVSLKKIEHGGSITLKGNKLSLNEVMFYQPGDNIPEGAQVGTPKPGVLTITHMDGSTTSGYDLFVITRGFQFSEGESAETRYEFIIMRMDGDPEPL